MNAGQASGVGFAQELAALSAVQHEHVLPVLAYNEKGDPDGYQYLVSLSLHLLTVFHCALSALLEVSPCL